MPARPTSAGASALALLVAVLVAVGASRAAAQANQVFVNELHYDNAGADTGEAVEVAGPAGTDLAGWSIVLYNGANGASYATLPLSGVLPDQDAGFGTLSFAQAGIQNGNPDGVALIDPTAAVVQFLSYGGTFTAVGGPANGLVSVDIGVSEGGLTPVGASLQLTGSGTDAADFTWAAAQPNTFGTVNTGQSFGDDAGPQPGDLVVNEIMQNPETVDDTAGEWFEILNVSSADIDIDGWIISDPGSESHTIANGGPLAVPAGGFVVLGADGDAVANGGVTVDYVYSGFTLDEAGDAVVLTDDAGTEFDRVAYDAGPTFPVPVGASMNLDPGSADTAANDDGTNWCESDLAFGAGDLGTPGAANSECPVETVLISAVQGGGGTVAISGAVAVDAIVTGLVEDEDVLDGFFVQEEDADSDGDAATSEGILVLCRGSCPADVVVGAHVLVQGSAGEFEGVSQIDARAEVGGSVSLRSTDEDLPTESAVDLPAVAPMTDAATFEHLEGMLVTVLGRLVVSEYFQLARFGEIELYETERPFQFTHSNPPSVPGYAAFLADLDRRRIVLDDDNSDQNDAIAGPAADEPYAYPEGGLSTDNRFRGGDTITDLSGVMHWGFGSWRLRPVPEEYDYTFTAENPRPAAPADVGGSLKVASFNVLNYFVDVDDGGTACGPTGGQECRGANSLAELDRQRDKIVSAIAEIDADVAGLIEIQNDTGAAVIDLVDSLNAVVGAGTYDYIDTGTIGTDAIKVALIYQPASVTPAGAFAVLDSSDDQTFLDNLNRPVLIQTFDENATGERVTVAVNHLKSKGSPCTAVGDPDELYGQANCNLTRTSAAVALAKHLATDPTASGDPDVLIIGDLNSYAMEDPITALKNAGYTDLVAELLSADAYSFLFDGQLSYLDHALANASLAPQVTGVAEWHVNADEVPLFDYNDDVLDAGEASFERESSALPLYEADPYRSADHDPLVLGLGLASEPILSCGGVSGTEEELEALGYDVTVGTEGDDRINALLGLRPDFVVALGGDDLVRTGLGADVVCGDGGDDEIFGLLGDDRIGGGEGDDTILGGLGADALRGEIGDDVLLGNLGPDSLSGGDGADECDGGIGGGDTTDGTCEAVSRVP